MDNATLSLLNNWIFWTFFALGILALLGSMLASYPDDESDEHESGGIGA